MQLFQSATLKLTTWYLGIIMLISIGFSLILFQVSNTELERQFSPRAGRELFINPAEFEILRQQRIEEGRSRLVYNLVVINLVTLGLGGAASYLLARRTLQPIAQAMEAQGRFTSDASHELRTPLAAMQAENEIALRNPKLSKGEMKALLESNLEEVNKLRALSDRLLQLSSEKQLELTPVNIEEAAIDAMNRVIGAAQAKRIAIDNVVQPTQVNGNVESLSDALTILLENAIKYSPEDTTVRVVSEAKGRQVHISVADQGIGIKASDVEHIFDRFYRADISRTSLKGTHGYGLGLAIAKRIIESHGGSIAVKSEPGKGATFTVQLTRA